MKTGAYIIILGLIASASFLGVRWLVRAYSRYRGLRTVTCPETGKPTLVEVDALHATLTSVVAAPDIRLENCTRWPLRQGCGQECLVNLDVAPHECLVSGVLMRWYDGKTCVYCGKHFDQLTWTDHKPAFLSPEGDLVQWSEIAIEKLPSVTETHQPVCWNCYIAQSFNREHPELVVYRPWQNENREATARPDHLI